jgi:coenzyme Q-binding protein COQ10
MTVYSERQILPYTPDQMFQLVAAVERYPEFLPWCAGSRILKRENNVIYADLMIGWKMIREKFGSKVTLTEPSKIHLDYFNGPLKYLHGDWQFTPNPGGGTIVDFRVDFDFKSRLLAIVMGGVFGEIVHRMVGAFESRAHTLYGPGRRTGGASAQAQHPVKQKA